MPADDSVFVFVLCGPFGARDVLLNRASNETGPVVPAALARQCSKSMEG